jgi:hypothetical protein
MDRNRRRWVLRLAAVLVAGLAALLWATGQPARDVLTVENRSGQVLAQLRVTVAGQTSTFQNVPAGGSVSAPFRIRADDHFAVEGRLADGTMVRSNGMAGEQARLIVLPGGEIKFQQRGR